MVYILFCGSLFHWKTLLEELKLSFSYQFTGKLPRIRRSRKQCDRFWPPIRKNLTWSETCISISRGTGLLRVASHGLSRLFLKTFAAVYFDPTRLTASGSPRMGLPEQAICRHRDYCFWKLWLIEFTPNPLPLWLLVKCSLTFYVAEQDCPSHSL